MDQDDMEFWFEDVKVFVKYFPNLTLADLNQFTGGKKVLVVRQEGLLFFVASIGDVGDWAVYFSNHPDFDAGMTVSYGIKVTRQLGESLFPMLAGLVWRP